MIQNFKKNIIKKQEILISTFLIMFFLLMLFGRSFTGLVIFGYRFGEWLTAFGLLNSLVILLLIISKKVAKNKKFFYLNMLIVFSFFYQLIIKDVNSFSTYLIKSSSYIWLISYIYIGFLIFKRINYENIFLRYITLILPIVYFFQTIYYPTTLRNFFISNSDKFEYLKAGDILLTFCLIVLISENNFKSKYVYTSFYLIMAAIFAPYFLYASKGSLLAFLIIFVFQIKNIIINLKKYKFKSSLVILFSVILFFSSTYHIYGNFVFKKEADNRLQIQEVITSGVSSILQERNTQQIFASFYFSDGRLYSEDVTANWRLQIWQDIISDLRTNNSLLSGYGYQNIIPAMDDPERRGTDGTNEHVHNYFINIFARGGLVQLILFIFLHFLIVNIYYQKYQSFKIIKFILPLLIVAFFDTSMESVRFPILYYSFLGYFYYEDSISIR